MYFDHFFLYRSDVSMTKHEKTQRNKERSKLVSSPVLGRAALEVGPLGENTENERGVSNHGDHGARFGYRKHSVELERRKEVPGSLKVFSWAF